MACLHSSFLLLVLILIIFQIQFCSTSKPYSNISCIDSERRALLKVRESLVDKSNRLSTWRGENCCAWEGVSCSRRTGHVVKLDLRNRVLLDPDRNFDDTSYVSSYSNNRLGGQISPSLVNLEHLYYLDLSVNDFSGTEIPTFFGSLKNLSYLNLSGAGFGGEIPNHLGNLSNLEYLHLGYASRPIDFYSSLTTKSLHWVAELSSLKSLDLSGVLIEERQDWLDVVNMLPSLSSLNLRRCGLGTLSPSLSNVNFTSLSSLDLGVNNLYSTFPLWLFNLSNLVNLQLDVNYLHGQIPDIFNYMTSVAFLDLSWNNLSSSLPNSVCRQTNLIHMNLEGNYLHGLIPLCLGNLSSLTVLNLRSNEFSGTIPIEIGHLGQLAELNLASNYLEGSIPSSLGQLMKLKSLDLSYNKLFGTVPSTLGKLRKLKVLDISSNLLSDALSEFHFETLKELKFLYTSLNNLILNVSFEWIPPFQLQIIRMDSTKIGPQFPSWLQTQKNVKILTMSNASISGTIPDWFGIVYSRIRILDLSSNNLSGKLPEFSEAKSNLNRWIFLSSNNFQGTLKPFPSDTIVLYLMHNSLTGDLLLFDGNKKNLSLQHLILNDNNLSGSIPDDICNIPTLHSIFLANNHLSGRIPECLGNLQQLVVLNLANNSLSGVVPSSLGNLELLKSLHLNGNKFYSDLPSSLQNLKQLETLDLGENQLKGRLPEWIGKGLSGLKFLRLQSNNFHGDISEHLCQLSFLQVLNLAQNKLTGYIPHCFQNLSMMASNALDSTYYVPFELEFLSSLMKGRELLYSSNLIYVKSIILSHNNLVGEIPNELMDLVGLQSLNLSNNYLSGSIPEKIGNLKQLESLDLSRNQLSGPIPPSFATLQSLNYLNLSFNKLSGTIPSGNQLQTLNDPSIYEGNSGLCGKPLPNRCYDESSKGNTATIDQQDDGEFDFNWFLAGIGPGFAVGFLGFCCILHFKKSWH